MEDNLRVTGENLSDFSYDSEDDDEVTEALSGLATAAQSSRFIKIDRAVDLTQDSNSDASSSMSSANGELIDDKQSGQMSARLFVRNNLFAFKSKKDF